MTRALRALLVAVAALLLLAAPAQTDPADPAALDLVDRPAWVAPVDEVSFLVAATGDVSAASVQLEVFSALDSVEELDESATEDVGVRLSLSGPTPVAELPPGRDGSRSLTLRVSPEPVDGETVQLVAPGVHPVVITLLAADGTELDQIRTPLVRLGDDREDWEAPDLAVLLDVAATPTLQPDGTRAIGAAELRRLARTGQLLADHPELGLSVAAVPDTVDALATLPDQSAEELLDRLGEQELLALPYLPLPLAALIDEGVGGVITPLVDRGDALLADRLGTSPERSVWTDGSAVGSDGARLLADLGFDAVLVDPPVETDDVEADDEPTPLVDAGPRAVVGARGLRGMVADPILSAELADAAGDHPDAGHDALARLLLRPVEDPDEDGESTVLARPGDLDADSVLSRLLPLLDDPRSPVRVGGLDLVPTAVDDEAEPVEETVVVAPDIADAARRVLAAAVPLDSLEGMIGTTSSRADALRLQVATALATTTPVPRRDAAMDTVEEELRTAFAGIRLSGQTDLNLTSRRGSLPVTVENANPFPVDVVVQIRSDRLSFPDGELVPVTVDAGDIRRIDVGVEALATGSVPVFVELWTPDDQVQLDGRRLNVRSTAISGVGVVLSLGALLVLVVWWARSWRRNRGNRADAPQPVAEPMG